MWTDRKLTDSAAALLSEVAADDWGQVAVSHYDTSRLVAIAPWLAGHDARVEFLHSRQAADGSWGGRDGYEIVPTLSATAALLSELSRTTSRGRHQRLSRSVLRGVAVLQHRLRPDAVVPDTIGVELLLPALLEELTGRVAAAAGDPFLAGLPADAVSRMRPPATFDQQLLHRARARFAARDLPQRAWACLEIFGSAAAGAPSVRPTMGAVGCSAAATAAWLGSAGGGRGAGVGGAGVARGDQGAGVAGDAQEALAFLDRLQARGGGPVPGVTPITYFEPAWILNSMAIGGLAPRVPPALLQRLEDGLTTEGAPAAPGLPPDADDTAAVLSALLRHGHLRSPDCLLGFQAEGYFRCFLDERNPSVSTNAHVLETLALYLTHRPDHRPRYQAPATKTAEWLLDRQQPDGCWWDKWHASPYYATACCVTALLWHDAGWARTAIDRAVQWLLDTQHADGSWGRWSGSVEETAYAIQTLAKAAGRGHATAAIARGAAYLADPATGEPPPLWHAKDLYAPTLVVRAAQLAALRLAHQVVVPHQRRAPALSADLGRLAPPA